MVQLEEPTASLNKHVGGVNAMRLSKWIPQLLEGKPDFKDFFFNNFFVVLNNNLRIPCQAEQEQHDMDMQNAGLLRQHITYRETQARRLRIAIL